MSSDDEYTPPDYMHEIAERYEAGERVADILKDPEYKDLPKSNIYYHFKKMDIQTGRSGPSRTSKAGKTIKRIEAEALTDEAEKIGNMAVTLGGCITRRHLPLLDSLISKNMTLEQIAEEIMDWYLSKKATKKLIENQESEITHLQEQLEYTYGMTLPNFRYELRTRILWKYAQQVLRARMIGVRIPVSRTLKAFYTDLINLEQEIEDIIIFDSTVEEEAVAQQMEEINVG